MPGLQVCRAGAPRNRRDCLAPSGLAMTPVGGACTPIRARARRRMSCGRGCSVEWVEVSSGEMVGAGHAGPRPVGMWVEQGGHGMGESGAPAAEGQDLSISLARANVLTLAVSLPLVGLMLLAYLALHPVATFALALPSMLVFLILLVVGILVHEGIHGLAWAYFGRFPLGRIRFGFQVSTLTPYAHALDPMPARAYRHGRRPAGPPAGGPAVRRGHGRRLGGSGAVRHDLHLRRRRRPAGAVADPRRRRPPRVLDHPSRAGCIVLASPAADGFGRLYPQPGVVRVGHRSVSGQRPSGPSRKPGTVLSPARR